MIPYLSTTGTAVKGYPLADAIECIVNREVNGAYELRAKYPITGLHYDRILNNRFIYATPGILATVQPFRIYRITKPLNGVVTIYARHVSYDMSGIIVTPFTSATLTAAIADVPNNVVPDMGGFTLATSRTVSSAMTIKEPRPLWKLLGGQQGSFLDVYGGEWDFDKYTATLVTQLGTNRGVEIRYAKNLTKLEADADLTSTYGGVFPYWYDEESNTYVAPSAPVMITGSPYTRILLLDCSGDFQTAPTTAELQTKASNYITANSVGDPKQSWKVSFALLAQSEDYKTQQMLEQVALGDTVTVIYDELGVDATARAMATEWNALKDQYESITIGRVKQNLASIIVGQNRETQEEITSMKSALETAVDQATDFIKNGAGYMRFIYNGSDELTEIVSLDNPDISQATNVWRWNNGGFGFSSTGYNGTYGLAITQNGAIVADYITTGTLNAARVKAGILSDVLNKNSWNLDTGALTITNGTINITTNSATNDLIVLNYQSGTVTQRSQMSPNGLTAGYKDTSDSTETSTAVNGFGMSGWNYNPSTRQTFGISASTGAFLAYHTTGNVGGVFDRDGIILKKSDGTTTAQIYSADGSADFYGDITGYGGVYISGDSGEIVFRDSSNVKRTQMDATGLQFWNSSSTRTAFYPSEAQLVTDFDTSMMTSFFYYHDSNTATAPSTQVGRVMHLSNVTGTVRYQMSFENNGTVSYNNVIFPYIRRYNNSTSWTRWMYLNNTIAETISTSGTDISYNVGNGVYLVTTGRSNSSSATQDGLWIAVINATSHITAIKAPSGGTTCTVSGRNISFHTGAANVICCITRIGP